MRGRVCWRRPGAPGALGRWGVSDVWHAALLYFSRAQRRLPYGRDNRGLLGGMGNINWHNPAARQQVIG